MLNSKIQTEIQKFQNSNLPIFEFYPQIKRYLTADYEPVTSRFSLSFNSVANLLHRNPPERIRELVELSFLSWKRVLDADKERQKAENLEKALENLQFDVNYKKGSKKNKPDSAKDDKGKITFSKKTVDRLKKKVKTDFFTPSFFSHLVELIKKNKKLHITYPKKALLGYFPASK